MFGLPGHSDWLVTLVSRMAGRVTIHLFGVPEGFAASLDLARA
jgi:hypothetical protein